MVSFLMSGISLPGMYSSIFLSRLVLYVSIVCLLCGDLSVHMLGP